MRARVFFRNPFKPVVIKAIRGTQVDLDRVLRAFMSLSSEDRDCMPYVQRLLLLEGMKADKLSPLTVSGPPCRSIARVYP